MEPGADYREKDHMQSIVSMGAVTKRWVVKDLTDFEQYQREKGNNAEKGDKLGHFWIKITKAKLHSALQTLLRDEWKNGDA